MDVTGTLCPSLFAGFDVDSWPRFDVLGMACSDFLCPVPCARLGRAAPLVFIKVLLRADALMFRGQWEWETEIGKAIPNVIACNITSDSDDRPVITDADIANPGRANHFVMGWKLGTPLPDMRYSYKWPPPQDDLFAAVYRIRFLKVMFTLLTAGVAAIA